MTTPDVWALGLRDLIDPNDAGVAAAPQTTYRRALDEGRRVIRFNAPDGTGGAVVFGRELVEHVLADATTFSSHGAVSLGTDEPLIPLEVDPPHHRRYRKLLDPIFAPRRVTAREDTVRALVNSLIDAFAQDDEVDLVPAFTEPLPSTIFLELLGLPVDDVQAFLDLKDAIIRPVGATPEHAAAAQAEAGLAIYELFDDALDARRDVGSDDLLGHLLTAELDGARLSRDEVLAICFLFLLAGLDTVAGQLSTSFHFLATNPEQRRRLVDDPSLVPAAVEELLRWQTIVSFVSRRVTNDVVLDGIALRAGDRVEVCLGSANIDGDLLDGVRLEREPNRHLAFGGGVHRCLGSHLARLELRVALTEFHRRIPDYELAAEPTFTTDAMRSATSLPLRLLG